MLQSFILNNKCDFMTGFWMQTTTDTFLLKIMEFLIQSIKGKFLAKLWYNENE
jgi:hypothetical protein